MAETKSNSTNSDPTNENRIVFFTGLFDENKVKEIITKIYKLEAQDPTKDILMYIDSCGGFVHSFLAIHDFIKHVTRCDIITLGIGKQMSCGQLLLMSGTKGKRFLTPNSRVLIHQISSMSWGKLADMEIDIKETKKLDKIICELIVKYTKINKKQLSEIMKIDSYISAEDAVKYGLADGIIKSPKDLYKRPNINL